MAGPQGQGRQLDSSRRPGSPEMGIIQELTARKARQGAEANCNGMVDPKRVPVDVSRPPYHRLCHLLFCWHKHHPRTHTALSHLESHSTPRGRGRPLSQTHLGLHHHQATQESSGAPGCPAFRHLPRGCACCGSCLPVAAGFSEVAESIKHSRAVFHFIFTTRRGAQTRRIHLFSFFSE